MLEEIIDPYGGELVVLMRLMSSLRIVFLAQEMFWWDYCYQLEH